MLKSGVVLLPIYIMISLFHNMDVEGYLLLAILLIERDRDFKQHDKNYTTITTTTTFAAGFFFFFCSLMCAKASIGFNYFPSVALLGHAAKLTHVKGAIMPPAMLSQGRPRWCGG